MGVEMCIGFMRHNGKRQIGADYKFHGGKIRIANPLSMGNGITNPRLNGQVRIANPYQRVSKISTSGMFVCIICIVL